MDTSIFNFLNSGDGDGGLELTWYQMQHSYPVEYDAVKKWVDFFDAVLPAIRDVAGLGEDEIYLRKFKRLQNHIKFHFENGKICFVPKNNQIKDDFLSHCLGADGFVYPFPEVYRGNIHIVVKHKINSFAGLPRIVKGDITVINKSNQPIQNLNGMPDEVISLSISNARLQSLQGCPKKMKNLNITSNNITSLEGMGSVSDVIWMNDNPIKVLNISCNLDAIYAANCEIQEIVALPAKLYSLDLSNNQLKSIPKLGQVWGLNLSGNELEGELTVELGSDSKFRYSNFRSTFGTSYVDVSNNKLTKLTVLVKHKSPACVRATGNQLEEVKLSSRKNFDRVNVRGNQIKKFTVNCPIDELDLSNNQLTYFRLKHPVFKLDLSRNKIKKIVYSNLEFDSNHDAELHLKDNELKSISNIAGNFRLLDISENRIQNLDCAGIKISEKFSASNNLLKTTQGENFECTASMVEFDNNELVELIIPYPVGYLFINNNQIKSLASINVSRLAHLQAANNQISDITPLRSVRFMSHLDLSGNQISDISPLAEIGNVAYITLGNNLIEDVTPLAGMCGHSLNISNNPISNSTIELSDFQNINALGIKLGDKTFICHKKPTMSCSNVPCYLLVGGDVPGSQIPSPEIHLGFKLLNVNTLDVEFRHFVPGVRKTCFKNLKQEKFELVLDNQGRPTFNRTENF